MDREPNAKRLLRLQEPDVDQVFRRRILSAPEQVLRSAFGTPDLWHQAWEGLSTLVVVVAKQHELKQHKRFETQYGSPLPLLLRESADNSEATLNIEAGTKFAQLRQSTFDLGTGALLGLSTDNSLSMYRCRLKGLSRGLPVDYEVRYAAIIRYGHSIKAFEAPLALDALLSHYLRGHLGAFA